MSNLKATNLLHPSSASNNIVLASDGTVTAALTKASLPSGSILQVVSTTKTDTFSVSIATGASGAVTGLTVAITPSSASSKVLVTAQIVGAATTSSGQAVLSAQLTRGGSPVGVGDAAGSRPQLSVASHALASAGEAAATVTISFLDSPATTSALTYGVNVFNTHSSLTQTQYVNRTSADIDNNRHGRFVSTITVMEVKA